jgi:amino acid adenylation domain-containing protein
MAVGFRLSSQQERLWTLWPDGPSGRALAVVEVVGDLDDEALRAAIGRVVSRHESLRTSFTRTPASRFPVQVVNDEAAWHWEVVELAEGAEPPTPDELRRRAVETNGERDWSLSATVFRRSPERRLLVLTAPAAVCDSRGLVLVADEALESLSGREAADEPLQYADYAAWQEEARADAVEPPVSDDADPVTQLPLTRNGDPTSYADSSLAIEVDRRLVLAAAAECGAELEDAWLAAWAVTVARLTGRERVVIATRIDGRSEDELARAVGPYVRTLPVACELPAGTTFRQAVQAVARARETVNRSQDSAAADAGSSLVGFAFRPLPALDGHDGLTAVTVEADDPVDFAPVTLSCSSAATRLLFDRAAAGEQAERAAGALQRVVESLSESTETDVWAIDVLSEPERRLLLDQLAHGPAGGPLHPPVHVAVEEHAARAPHIPAVTCGGDVLDYGELNARANRVAHALRERGVNRNTPVAICMDRSLELIVGILGILKAGGAYVPLHPEHPRSRLEFQLADSSAQLVLTRASLAPLLAGLPGEPLLLDGDAFDGMPAENPDRVTEPDDLAYLIYTSGTTGVPKAVAVKHAGVSNYTTAIGSVLGLSEPLRFGLVTSVSTDLGNTSVFGALSSGGCLELVPVEVALDGRAFAEYLSGRPLDVLKITPSHLAGLLAAGDARILPSKHVVIGGEPLSWELADRVLGLGGCSVTSHYGPTETTIGSLTHRVGPDPSSRALARTVPIGRPLAATDVYVVDGRLTPVPLGTPGELLIGGAGLARGYWGNEQETAERFVKHPFATDEGALLYRTGDLVRYLPDGEIEFLGRIDEQVKVRGYRVEPSEVDHVMGRYHGVAQCATVARDDAVGDRQLVAYVVLAPASGLGVADLKAHAQEHLPDHMVPAAFVCLDALPLGPSGKLDRAALPPPDTASSGSEYVAPRDEDERRVCEIWEQLLGVERVGVFDNFFELGGHSLLATQVIARIRSAFGVQLPLHSLFTAPNVAELTEALKAATAAAAPPDDDDLVALLEEIEGLSDEEAQRLLESERNTGDGRN